MKKGTKANTASITIAPPNFITAQFKIRGTSPLVMHKFSEKTKEELRAKHEGGSASKNTGKKRTPKDFKALSEAAKHVSKEGWVGIPAAAFRAAAISACRLVGFKMTIAKLSIFIEQDGYDRNDKTPLVKITKGEPYHVEHVTRNADGSIDIRPRPMWDPGWEADLRVRWDADQFSLSDVANLLMRIGQQVGIMEGRPDSKKSCGQGWGMFTVLDEGVETSE